MNRFVSRLGLALSLLVLTNFTARGSGQDNGKRDPSAQTRRNPTDDRIDFEASVTPKEVRRGETVKLTITGKLRPGFHTYPITQRTADQDEMGLSKMTIENLPSGLKLLWPIKETEPEVDVIPNVGTYLEHKSKFDWWQDIIVLPDATPGRRTIKVHINLQVCDANCVWGDHYLQTEFLVTDAEPKGLIRIPVGPGPEAKPVPKREPTQVSDSSQAKAENSISMADRPEEHRAALEKLVPLIKGGNSTSSSTGLLAFMLAGVFWGAITLVTPCVFPMIPITVSYFLKQSEKEHHKPLTMALVYTSTIVVVLTLAALVLLETLKQLSIHPLMNFALGALFIFFALSLFGMYEIELPAGLARFTSAREGKGGMIGTIFMALTFTIISFACVAPFLGGFAGTAATSGLTWYHRLFGGLAFSLTFAAPFFLLALFPTLLKKLPKSGSWLNSVKVVMGFLELAAALKFFRAGELVLIPRPAFFTYDLVLGMWIALGLLCGLYLLNFYRLPYDTPADHIGVSRLLFGFLFLSLSFYLVPALFRFSADGENQRPNGTIYAWIDSFLLPEPREGKSELAWTGNLPRAIDEARAQRQLVFIDFTGETCTNCKWNENNVFAKPEIKELFRTYRLAQLYTDKVPDKYYSSAVRSNFGNDASRQRQDAAANLWFQIEAFGDEKLPLYVILDPKADGTIEVVGQYAEGKINDETAFAQFLREPLSPRDGTLRAQLSGN
jgi:thiol:disulfide interchange protein DsbD